MKLIWVNCFLPLDCCYLLATANVAALFLRWSVFPYVLTETAQFSTQHSVSKTKIAIREALHVSKQMYHFHVNILVFYSVWKWDTANRRYRTLPYSYVFSFTYRARYSADKLYTLVCTSGTVAIRLHSRRSCNCVRRHPWKNAYQRQGLTLPVVNFTTGSVSPCLSGRHFPRMTGSVSPCLSGRHFSKDVFGRSCRIACCGGAHRSRYSWRFAGGAIRCA